jgi:hypothetical protein
MFMKVLSFNSSAAAGIIIPNQFTVRNMEILYTKSSGFKQF